jgi:hypothetical protein
VLRHAMNSLNADLYTAPSIGATSRASSVQVLRLYLYIVNSLNADLYTAPSIGATSRAASVRHRRAAPVCRAPSCA